MAAFTSLFTLGEVFENGELPPEIFDEDDAPLECEDECDE